MPDISQWAPEWYKFSNSRFYLRSFSQVSVSNWTASRNIYGPHAQLWICELTLTTLEKELWMPMEAFIMNLGGQSGLMRIADVARMQPLRNYESTGEVVPFSDNTFFNDGSGWLSEALPPTLIVVDAAVKGSTTLHVAGLPVSLTRLLRRNDAFEIKPNGFIEDTPHYYACTLDANSDASGETLLEFRPPLRTDIAAGAVVTISKPHGLFRLFDDDQGIFDRKAPYLGQGSFKLVEAIK